MKDGRAAHEGGGTLVVVLYGRKYDNVLFPWTCALRGAPKCVRSTQLASPSLHPAWRLCCECTSVTLQTTRQIRIRMNLNLMEWLSRGIPHDPATV